MSKGIIYNFFLVSFMITTESYADTFTPTKCPTLNVRDLKQLDSHKELKISGHKWYLADNYKVMRNVLGTDRPSMLALDEVEIADSIELSKSIGDRQCLYKITLPQNHMGFLLFSLIGEPRSNNG